MEIMMNANLDELTEGQLQRVQTVSEEKQIVVARKHHSFILPGNIEPRFRHQSKILGQRH